MVQKQEIDQTAKYILLRITGKGAISVTLMPTEGVIGTRLCMLACHFYACLAGVTPNQRCINVDVTVIITIAIFNDIINS